MKTIKIILTSVLGLGLILALTTGGNILFFWSIFNWIQSSIHIITGFDAPIAKVLAAILMAAIVILPFGKILMSFSPIPQKNKKLYRIFLFIGISAFFLLAYFGAKDTYFNVKTGKALKYYSVFPNGEYKFYSEPGFDPLTGDSLKMATKEVVLKSKGLLLKRKLIVRVSAKPPAITYVPVYVPIYFPMYIPAPVPVPAPTPTPTVIPNTGKISSPILVSKKKHRRNHVVKLQAHDKPNKYKYCAPQPVDQTSPESASDNYRATVVQASSFECSVRLANKTNQTMVVINSDGNVIYTIGAGCFINKKMEPGRYYAQNNHSDKKAFVITKNENLSFDFMDAVGPGYHPIYYLNR